MTRIATPRHALTLPRVATTTGGQPRRCAHPDCPAVCPGDDFVCLGCCRYVCDAHAVVLSTRGFGHDPAAHWTLGAVW